MISKSKIILWWELRRLPFNLLLLLLSTIVFQFLGISFMDIEMGSGDYFVFVLLPLILITILNILYSFGWILETLFKERKNKSKYYFIIFSVLSSVVVLSYYLGIIYILKNR